MAYPMHETFSMAFVTRLDEPGGGVTYIGIALPGAATSAAVWQIKRMTVSGTSTVIQYASGSTAFAYVWDDRAGLSYS